MFNRLKAAIENPNSLSIYSQGQHISLPNSMSPAAMATPSSYLGVSSNSGYNMAGGMNNFRAGGASGHRSEFRYWDNCTSALTVARSRLQGEPVLLDPTTAGGN